MTAQMGVALKGRAFEVWTMNDYQFIGSKIERYRVAGIDR